MSSSPRRPADLRFLEFRTGPELPERPHKVWALGCSVCTGRLRACRKAGVSRSTEMLGEPFEIMMRLSFFKAFSSIGGFCSVSSFTKLLTK